ncbi:MAG: hypothetical protein RJA22_831 [Verrucomicrobiota bacterium]
MTRPSDPAAIRLRGVRHNNLKNFDLDLPLGQLTVITGLSGSGKSSLAFDTLFAEGQRRYIETFSPYARQFFDRMDKPQVDRIEGIPPAIAIEQRNSVRSTRSTVGTMTELCDYLKLLWPHVAQLHCRQCGRWVRPEPPAHIWDERRAAGGGEVLVAFRVPLSDKLPLAESLELVARQGYQRVLLGAEVVRVEDAAARLGTAARELVVVQDRLAVTDANRARFVEACEQAYHFGKGRLSLFEVDPATRKAGGPERRFSAGHHCAACDLEYREPSTALFSFNHPMGACPACKGFGRLIRIDYDLAIPDRSKTLAGGAIKPWQTGMSAECQADLAKFCRAKGIPMDVPFERLPAEVQDWVIQGDQDYDMEDPERNWPRRWYGVKGYFRWLESKAYKMHVRVLLSRYRAYTLCPECRGKRLNAEALLYQCPADGTAGAASLSLADFYALPVERALAFIEGLAARRPAGEAQDPVTLALGEVRARLRYLVEVGLGYLTLDRPTRTLSGGETSRVNLTTCLGTRLVNTLFVLDEPSVGLHPRDTDRLIRILHQLRDLGNTIVVVEHEASVMRAADRIVDLGPGQGEKGGELVFFGPVDELLECERSLTGQYLSGKKSAGERAGESTSERVSELASQGWLRVGGASRHNLRGVDVAIPLGRLVAVTGVSGSGKTTLVREVLLPALEARLKAGGGAAGPVKASDRMDAANGGESGDTGEQEDGEASPGAAWSSLEGWEALERVVLVDQSPLGKTPRSNPVVYVGAFDDVRDLFAQTELARQRGLNGSAFSFNSAVGQCERCRGAGFEKIEMQFLSDVFIRCPDCNGRRYRGHILEVKLGGTAPGGKGSSAWSIADMLEATVDDALEFLAPQAGVPAGRRALAKLRLLQEVGLGYLRLGQPVNTLSGGESQRLKLASHLADSAAQEAETAAMAAGVVVARTRAEARRWLEERAAGGAGKTPPAEARRGTLFLFDEPTTGLHFEDVRILLLVFRRLVRAGHSVLVIEHNLDVIRSADWVLDLGPDAGDRGGRLVAAGTPAEVAECAESHTGRFLREVPGGAGSGAARRAAGQAVRELAPPYAASTAIAIQGAREHNLRNLSLEIPRGRFVVVTGVSGSGKSTLAFDLLFAEGQRRFLDSMNTYARQFVEQFARPEVDRITGLPPTVSIEQRTTRGGGKSTVATVTEVYHFLRLLYARLGVQHCPDCALPVESQTRDAVAAGLERERRKRGALTLLAPVVRNRKGFHTDVAEWAARHGYARVRADGRMHDTAQPFRLDRFSEHDVEIVVGVLGGGARSGGGPRRPQQLVDEALDLGKGTVFALDARGRLTIHSTERACPKCARSFAPLDPKNFSYNSAQGWCPRCRGFGELFYLPEVERGANADAVEESWWSWAEEREVCPECHGARLRPEARAVRLRLGPAGRAGLGEPTIEEFSGLSVSAAHGYFRRLKFKGREALIARDILPEMVERLNFLEEVGLGYLQLGRAVTTLSGGEAQRIRLAAQLGSNLSGVLYVLDEPTIGLHARDNEQLLAALHQLQDRGNSLVVVEHDEETMRRADYVIDLGPGAGVHGGQVVAAGTLPELLRHEDSVTGRCLRALETKQYPTRGERRPVAAPARGRARRGAGDGGSWLTLAGAAVNNLQDLTVRIPLNRLVVVTGVSGSGKSTLVRECLLPAVTGAVRGRGRGEGPRGAGRVTGHEGLKGVYEVDQSPIGRTPRSTPATYVGFFDEIRQLFAQTPEARMRGYGAGRFSFNSAQGRCPDCEGAGVIKLEMNFLPPAYVKCEACGGRRFSRETLDIEYGGRNIAQVLDLSVEEGLAFFAAHPRILRPLEALHDTGLDYLKLGQTSPTLSGGEAQRVKLVTHLLTGLKGGAAAGGHPGRGRRAGEPAAHLFILEEPTIGLHMSDVGRLVGVLQRLVDAGHSVVVIEHNLDLIAEADWVIDLGPEGGAEGGRVVAEGTPEQVARVKGSHTGRFLRSWLRGAFALCGGARGDRQTARR